jgi:hypothetical protein
MKRSADTSKLSHYLSTVQTTHGEGATFELILDDKGQISSTLTAVIRDTEVPYSTIRALLDDLRSYLLTQKICVRDLSPNNIMCQQQDGKLNLFIVDGVSNPGINPLNIRVAFMSRYFIKRSWRSLERKVDGLYQELSRHHTDRYKCSPDIEA